MARQSNTRGRILDTAEAAVLEKGFEATSIEEIVAAVEITKSGFFYHFPDKNALGTALIARYIDSEDVLFDGIFSRAEELDDDPLHAMLIALRFLAEIVEDLPGGHPGCLVATAVYQSRLFDRAVHEMNQRAALRWRALFLERFERIAAAYPPRAEVALADLADAVLCVVEGGIVMSKALRDPKLLVRQLMLLRSQVKLLFTPPRMV
ncbi:TetR/AcrR family transcriptional regulator [Aestuariibius sp. 2305UL40-4]|uniref:TetR/AcrR family transcriptional regulator n=1 Tax=Aestuariibius violaceus TaxID=3234132 RepID=UPI00345EAC29